VTPGDWQCLAQRFELGYLTGDPGYVTRGAMGEIWRLDTSNGRWAVKWQFPWAPADPRPLDATVQLAAAAAGVPLPLPVTAPDADAVAAVGGRHARVYHWVELGQPVLLPATPAVAADAGRLLGLLHRLGLTSDEPVDPWYTQVRPADYWTELADRATAAGAAWAPRLAGARGLVAYLSEFVTPPPDRPVIVCHRDFNPGNVIPAVPDGRLTVLDWENCGPLDPVRELGYAVYTWSCGGGRFDAGAAEALLAGYASATGADPELPDDLFATAVATHVNVLGVMAEQAIAEPEHRRYAEARIAELLDDELAELRQLLALWPAAIGRTAPASAQVHTIKE